MNKTDHNTPSAAKDADYPVISPPDAPRSFHHFLNTIWKCSALAWIGAAVTIQLDRNSIKRHFVRYMDRRDVEGKGHTQGPAQDVNFVGIGKVEGTGQLACNIVQ